MRRTLFAAVAVIVSLAGAKEPPSVLVHEAEIHAILTDESTAISLPIESKLLGSVAAKLSLDWIDNEDNTVGSARQNITIEPGRTSISAALPISKPTIWLRLRYSLSTVEGGSGSFMCDQAA